MNNNDVISPLSRDPECDCNTASAEAVGVWLRGRGAAGKCCSSTDAEAEKMLSQAEEVTGGTEKRDLNISGRSNGAAALRGRPSLVWHLKAKMIFACGVTIKISLNVGKQWSGDSEKPGHTASVSSES